MCLLPATPRLDGEGAAIADRSVVETEAVLLDHDTRSFELDGRGGGGRGSAVVGDRQRDDVTTAVGQLQREVGRGALLHGVPGNLELVVHDAPVRIRRAGSVDLERLGSDAIRTGEGDDQVRRRITVGGSDLDLLGRGLPPVAVDHHDSEVQRTRTVQRELDRVGAGLDGRDA